MSGLEIFFLVAQVLGGLALFIFGMKVMSEGLQQAAGNRLRGVLFHITRHRLAGLGVGTTLGLMVHSSAATVMVVGFINAGLMTLVQSIPVILGANVGTTLSMQLVSLRLTDYAFAGVAVGLLLQLASRREWLRHVGSVVFGFGLLFLGMRTMSDGVGPLKGTGTLESLLSYASADSIGGIFLGFLVSTAITGVIQSSGAMIGILFALGSAGVFTEIGQVFPLVLGAHVGTCATALLGSLGTNIEARRSALAHLLFNVLGALLAIAMIRFYLWLVPLTSGDLTHQIANAHTAVQLINALVLLPFAGAFAALVVKLSPSKAAPPERSHLDDRYLDTPETAILAVVKECRRMGMLARRTLLEAMRGFVKQEDEPLAEAGKSEQAVDELKKTIGDFLLRITERRLSRRQAVMAQRLESVVSDIERIGDHAEQLAELSQQKRKQRVWFDDQSMEDLVELFRRADAVMCSALGALAPELSREERQAAGVDTLRLRQAFRAQSFRLHERNRQRVLDKTVDAMTGLFWERFAEAFDRIARHAKRIADHELEPLFFFKEHKFDRRSEKVARDPLPAGGLTVDDCLFDGNPPPKPPPAGGPDGPPPS
jgi:phosphate:Na+ symporter